MKANQEHYLCDPELNAASSVGVWLEHLLVYLMRILVLFIPIQLGLHFWPTWTMLLGRRIDYLSPTLYVTDCVLITSFICWITLSCCTMWERRRLLVHFNSKQVILLGAALVVVAVNILGSLSWQVSLYRWVKAALFGFVVIYISSHPEEKIQYVRALVMGALLSSILAIGQFVLQRSVGGIFWYMGERLFIFDTPLIARAHLCTLSGTSCQLLLRPYATFAHPNLLGGYLTVTLFLFVTLKEHVVDWIYKGAKTFVVYCGMVVLGVSLLLTMSRTAIFTQSLLLLWWFGVVKRLIHKSVTRILIVGMLVATVACMFALLPFNLGDESIRFRETLNSFALATLFRHAFFGVGLGNFLLVLSKERTVVFLTGMQPVHNVFLLALVELGAISSIFLSFIAVSIWNMAYVRLKSFPSDAIVYSAALVAIGFLGLFDHYIWTLQQGQLLAAVCLGLYMSAHYRRA